jgi:hypothetical protein
MNFHAPEIAMDWADFESLSLDPALVVSISIGQTADK